MSKDFWSKSRVVVFGGGSWGTVLAELASKNTKTTDVWVRREEQARSINSTRANTDYLADFELDERIRAFSDLERIFSEPVDLLIWALPSKVCREMAREVAPFLQGSELVIHATKGVEQETLKTASTILLEELPCRRIGVVSGPNLAKEIARGEPAATVVASGFDEVIQAGQAVLHSPRFRVYSERDVIGVEWAGTLKNVLAIASGTVDALGMGWNTRAMLMTRGLAEMVRFGVALGAKESTFLGLAGVGDLLATCGSDLSRNYRVGYGLGEGKKLDEVLNTLGSTAEGIRTAKIVHEFATQRGIDMPITSGVYRLLEGRATAEEVLLALMERPVHR